MEIKAKNKYQSFHTSTTSANCGLTAMVLFIGDSQKKSNKKCLNEIYYFIDSGNLPKWST